MLGRYPPAVNLEDLGDEDSDGPVESLDDDPRTERIKVYSDTQLDDEIKKYKDYVAMDNLKLPDGGAKFRELLQKLEQVKSARANKRSPLAVFRKPQALVFADDDDDDADDDFSSGAVRDWKTRCGTGSTALSGGLGTCSTVKTEALSTKISGSAPDEALKSAKVSSETIRESPSPEGTACSLGRATHSSSGEEAGPSRRELSGTCCRCGKSCLLPGLLCSMCRQKAQIKDIDLKTPAEKLIARRSRKRKPEADVVGRTLDTAMEIDSSDEDEKPSASNGFTFKSVELPRRMGLRGNLRRRMESLKVKIAYPSRTDPDAVEICPADLKRLDPMEFLNDTVIDFYIKYIQREEFLTLERRQRFHFFNSFFYKKLSEVVSSQKKKGGADFSKLRKWTKGTNIFEKDYLFVPIHDKLHWSLAIICFPGCDKGDSSERCIIHLDSMTHGHDSQRVFRLLRSYLVAEWKHSVEAGESEADECPHTLQSLKNDDIPYKKVPVPLQDNESDCGLFLLHYIQKFVEHAPKAMKPSDLEGSWKILGVFGRDWFHSTEASSLRTSIQEQLIRLFEQEEQGSKLGQSNKEEDKSDCSTTGVCEVVISLDGEASCKHSATYTTIDCVRSIHFLTI